MYQVLSILPYEHTSDEPFGLLSVAFEHLATGGCWVHSANNVLFCGSRQLKTNYVILQTTNKHTHTTDASKATIILIARRAWCAKQYNGMVPCRFTSKKNPVRW